MVLLPAAAPLSPVGTMLKTGALVALMKRVITVKTEKTTRKARARQIIDLCFISFNPACHFVSS
jgi:hypothetical protein